MDVVVVLVLDDDIDHVEGGHLRDSPVNDVLERLESGGRLESCDSVRSNSSDHPQ